MTNPTPPLRPCPFCQNGTQLEVKMSGKRIGFVECHACGATGPEAGPTQVEAIIAWNAPFTRTSAAK